MKGFWRLYVNEFRFLAGPGIALIVLWLGIDLLQHIINYISWDYYFNNIMLVPDDPAFIVRYMLRPIIVLPQTADDFIYGTLFLYALLYEHITPSKYQILMLPLPRALPAVAILGAVVSWELLSVPAIFIWQNVLDMILICEPLPWQTSEVRWFIHMFWIIGKIVRILSICGPVMLGFAVAVSVKRWPYVVGIMTTAMGYRLREHIVLECNKGFGDFFLNGVQSQYYPGTLSLFITHTIAASLLFGFALILYERFREV